jgi:hypothetical protein
MQNFAGIVNTILKTMEIKIQYKRYNDPGLFIAPRITDTINLVGCRKIIAIDIIPKYMMR